MHLGSYEILEEVARGGMGIVYKAKQIYMNRIVALKVLLSGGAASDKEITRFHREAEAAGSLQHPNIVSIYEVGQEEGFHYFTMDFIEGETLQTLIKKRARLKNIAKIVWKVAQALAYAHERGIVHRDIKPSNIIVSKEGEPKITDFGLAKKMDNEQMLTESNSTLGTPYYMAPEQILGRKDADGRSDVYSLGVILYESITHRLPFHATTLMELYHKVVEEEAIRPRKLQHKCDVDLETICLKAMAKNPEERYSSAQALAEDLERYLNNQPILAKRPNVLFKSKTLKKGIWLGGAIGVLLLCLLSILLIQLTKQSSQERQRVEAEILVEEAKALFPQKIQEAMSKLDQAQKLDPKNIHIYLTRAKAYLEVLPAKPHLALLEYDRVAKLGAQDQAALGRGRAYLHLQDLDTAITAFNSALKENPDFLEVYLYRAKAWEAKKTVKGLEQAFQDYQKLEVLKKKILAQADTNIQSGKYKEALAIYERVLSVQPDSAEAYHGRGKVYFAQQNWDLALKEFDQAIQLNPKLADAYYKKYLSYQKLGKTKEAQETLQKAPPLGQENP